VKSRIVVVDYGVGNLLSVSRAFESCGAEVVLSRDPQVLSTADRLVVPGVGAFADGMEELRRRGLVEPIRSYAQTGRPLLGICLGMQLLFSVSHEFGKHTGLGILAGSVVAIPTAKEAGGFRKTPHIGWNELRMPDGRSTWSGSILEGLAEGAATYFVHSYMADPEEPAIRLADCDYEGIAVSAAVQRGMIFGCQFHPEKSGETGLRIVHNFMRLTS
jgi:glutamine amidotransferase